MKALKNHQILFDAECPMCSMYTKAFVDTGLLDKGGRAAYQEMPAGACPMLDRQRAANEIALVNNETGEVTYGIESLFKIFALVMPFFGPLFRFKPFIWLMSKVYAFIAFNRRVIVPPPKEESYAFQPTFKLHYRIAYLIFTWFITASIISGYSKLMTGILPDGHAYREYFICGGQIFFQGITMLMVKREKIWTYLGNMMTISFGGALLLLPALLLSVWFSLDPLFYLIWFMGAVGLMLLEHIRRCALIRVGWILTLTWISYIVLVYFLICYL